MCITETANYNQSIIAALNGCFGNWCSQTLKCLHQLLCPQESPCKCCAVGRKAFWKLPYQSSGSESLKCFTSKMSKWAEALRLCLCYSKVDPACMSGPAEEIQSKPLCVACDGRTATFPPTLTDCYLHLFIYGILHRSIKLSWEEFHQPLYGGGPFTADKNSKYKHGPIRELAANQPLPQRDVCYLQRGLSLTLSDSTQGPLQKTLRWARCRYSHGLKANRSP